MNRVILKLLIIPFLSLLSCEKEPEVQEESAEISVEMELQNFANMYNVLLSEDNSRNETLYSLKSRPGRPSYTGFSTNLSDLSDIAKSQVVILDFIDVGIEEIPFNSWPRDLDRLSFVNNKITDISRLASINCRVLSLAYNPISDISPIRNNESIYALSISNTTITELPDFSHMASLVSIDISETTLSTLENIDTIPNPFQLYILRCSQLEDISALLNSRVRRVVIDSVQGEAPIAAGETEGTYDRFEEWFEENRAILEERNPGFTISIP